MLGTLLSGFNVLSHLISPSALWMVTHNSSFSRGSWSQRGYTAEPRPHGPYHGGALGLELKALTQKPRHEILTPLRSCLPYEAVPIVFSCQITHLPVSTPSRLGGVETGRLALRWTQCQAFLCFPKNAKAPSARWQCIPWAEWRVCYITGQWWRVIPLVWMAPHW